MDEDILTRSEVDKEVKNKLDIDVDEISSELDNTDEDPDYVLDLEDDTCSRSNLVFPVEIFTNTDSKGLEENHQAPVDTKVVSHCIGPLPPLYLKQLPHHAPCTNLHRVLPQETGYPLLLKPCRYVSSVPVPLTSLTDVPREVLNGIDPTTDLIREKIKWQMKKRRLLQAARNDKTSIGLSKKALRKSMRVGSNALVPQGVFLLAQHLDKDPDPCFTGMYNWYYTGGTLATMKRDDTYLLHATNSDIHCSRIVGGKRTGSSSLLKINSEEPIYQITTNSEGAAVRQKSRVHIFADVDDSDDEGLQLKKIHCVSSKKHPFISVALQENSIQKYCTISNKGSMKLWDVEYSNTKCKYGLALGPGEEVIVTDSWSSLQFLDNRTLLMADRCCLHTFDIRHEMKEKGIAWCPKKITEQCEELSYIVRSRLRNDIVYVATTHQLFCLDLRFGFCQRWTHMMAAPPYLGFTQAMDNDHELVCLGSQILSDCVSVVNTWSGDQPQSSYMPSILPSPGNGLHCARQQGLCLEPSLTQRCTQSMTGLTCLPAENGVHVVRQSATGDVFIQRMSAAQEVTRQLTGNELAAYSEWSGDTSLQNKEPVKVTGVEDFIPSFKAITNPDIPSGEVSETTNDENANKTFHWNVSKKYLEDCVDLLAGKILAVWEVEEEDEWAPDLVGEEETSMEQDPTEKVQNWLETANLGATASQDITTEESTLKPRITSTPFPADVPQEEVSPINLPGPFTTLSQQTPALQITSTDKPRIPSTLFPADVPQEEVSPINLPGPFTTLSQRTPAPQITSTDKPRIPSFPSDLPQEEVSPINLPGPFTTLSQQTPAPQITSTDKPRIPSFPSGQLQSPPSSNSTEKRRRKRQKLFHDTLLSTPPKQPANAKKPQSSAKKKFVPGF